LPDFETEVRLATRGYAGELAISQYQYQTFTLRQGILSRCRWRYGPIYFPCSNYRWWRIAYVRPSIPDPYRRIFLKDSENCTIVGQESPRWHRYWRYRWFWRDCIEIPYWYLCQVTKSINGSQIAQTFLNAQNGWLTAVALYFTKKEANGTVYLHLCETKNGLPDPERCIAETSLEPSAFNTYPEPTVFEFPRPVFLKAGTRYALLVTTAGNHRLAVVSGEKYTQGTLFYSTDGAYFLGDLTKDLMMDFHFARFKSAFCQVELKPISLSDGIAGLDLLAGMVVPDACDLIFEYQLDGHWYPVEEATADNLLGLPAMLPLRVSFVGSSDVMPGLELSGSRLRAVRPATHFKHLSTERTLPAASSQIQVQLLLENFDPSKHTVSCKLQVGTDLVDPASEAEKQEDTGVRKTYTFDFSQNPVSSYKIVVEGTTTTALEVFHVAERIDIAF
ncbi:MAG: hypothetical protein DSZ24_04250, partial [Thermodesulfatator sp.]